jgi:hypothetical protein
VSATAHVLPSRELVLDRYRPLRPLGSGASGSVWLARDESNGLDVALKIVPREGKAGHRAEREAEAAADCRAVDRADNGLLRAEQADCLLVEMPSAAAARRFLHRAGVHAL